MNSIFWKIMAALFFLAGGFLAAPVPFLAMGLWSISLMCYIFMEKAEKREEQEKEMFKKFSEYLDIQLSDDIDKDTAMLIGGWRNDDGTLNSEGVAVIKNLVSQIKEKTK